MGLTSAVFVPLSLLCSPELQQLAAVALHRLAGALRQQQQAAARRPAAAAGCAWHKPCCRPPAPSSSSSSRRQCVCCCPAALRRQLQQPQGAAGPWQQVSTRQGGGLQRGRSRGRRCRWQCWGCGWCRWCCWQDRQLYEHWQLTTQGQVRVVLWLGVGFRIGLWSLGLWCEALYRGALHRSTCKAGVVHPPEVTNSV